MASRTMGSSENPRTPAAVREPAEAFDHDLAELETRYED